ncbi:MAG: DUF2934 domain-containing protein [Chloroflexi bacterium]|nr:DUF2934 domain-containing protein [Chloroflexota bacterium]
MTTPTTQPARAASASRVPEPPSGDHALAAERVAVRAYEPYCARGCEDGRDVEDWMDAERQLRDEGTSESKDA